MSELTREKAREDRLKSALERLENDVDVPIVPGEAVAWSHAVEVSLAELQPLLEAQVDRAHNSAFQQIDREDPEMFQRIEQMQTEDQAIDESFQDIHKRLRLLKSVTERVDQDEKRVESAIAEFVPLAQTLVARIRRQEVAVRTWLMEAFNRDRGVVD